MKVHFKKIYFFTAFAILILPSLGLLFNIRICENCENRSLATAPKFSWSKDYIEAFEKYYNDNFSFKSFLNHVNASIKYSLFNSSTKPNKAVIGEDDFFFYTVKGDNILDSYLHTDLRNEQELQQIMNTLLFRKDTLQKLGIELYNAYWPNKSTVYSEYVPKTLQSLKKDTLSKSEQIIEYLKHNRAPIEILDVSDNLYKNKNLKIYYKYDTHWNSLGAYLAFEKLMEFMSVDPIAYDSFNVEWKETTNGDLKNMLSLCNNDNIKEVEPIYTYTGLVDSVRNIETSNNYIKHIVNSNAPVKKTILLFCDSYANALIQFLQFQFTECYIVSTNFQLKSAIGLKPDVVVCANVERYFWDKLE